MIRFYNTLTRQKEEFVPLEPGKVRMYNCGPTVYNFIHIGNLRSFLLADTLRRVLELEGFEVQQVMNLTDVGHLLEAEDGSDGEDRLERQAALEKVDAWQIANRYAEAFFEDIHLLKIKPADVYPRATEHIEEMLQLIKRLLEGGYAYEVDGEVYYDISRFSGYGKLSGNSLEDLNAGHRVEINERKRHPFDFALWKVDPRHQMKWQAPWSEGFPGWHIECSAMSMRYLGEELDIHTGGEDNIFPHHESEIAQSEGATGKPFVRYWLHARYLLVDGIKMSKSLGNFFTVRDLLKKGYRPEALRYALLVHHYRQPQNFTLETLEAAGRAVAKIQDMVDGLLHLPEGSGPASPEVEAMSQAAENSFREALRDDLETPRATAAIFGLIREIRRLEEKRKLEPCDGGRLLKAFHIFDELFDVLSFQKEAIPPEITGLVKEREHARNARDWARSDELRDQIRWMGYLVEDTRDGPRLKVL